MSQGKARSDFYGKTSGTSETPAIDEGEIDENEKFIYRGLESALTPLQVACLLGYKEIVSFLITEGKSNANLKGKHNYNSIWFSILGKQPEITQYLLSSTDVDYDQEDDEGMRPRDLIASISPEYVEHFDKLVSLISSERERKATEEAVEEEKLINRDEEI